MNCSEAQVLIEPSDADQSRENQRPTHETKNNKKTQEIKRKPDGMHREVYNLLVHQGKEDRIDSIIPTDSKRGYTCLKAQLNIRKPRRWHWTSFKNHARTDGLQLDHWERAGDKREDYPFAKFNKVMSLVIFSEEEYEEHLQDSRWSVEETRHLLDLCHRFDLRWPIILDRFDKAKFKDKKSIEDMKERYYNLVNELNAVRNAKSEKLCYDADSERRRKEQLEKLWGRTEEQIKEEDELRAEVRRIEAKRKDRERKANEVQLLISTAERVSLSPENIANSMFSTSGNLRAHRRSTKNKICTPSIPTQLITSSESYSIRWPNFVSPGPHLRSQEMKIPSNVGQKKLKNIELVIEGMKLDPYPNAFEEVVKLYNNFRSNVVLLQELKAAMANAESDIDQLTKKLKEEKGKSVEISPRMRISNIFYEEYEKNRLQFLTAQNSNTKTKASSSDKGQKSSNTKDVATVTSRRIARIIDTTQINQPMTRKRRNRPPSGSSSTATTSQQSNTA